MAEPDLLPCPFCGGEAHIVEGEDGESAYVQCTHVKMHRAIWFDGDNNAANEVREQWNRRAPAPTPDQTNAEVSDERLRELLPCPFCGGAAEWCKGERGDGTPWPYLACEDCEAMGPAVAHPATESEWITAWNRRSVTSQASEGEPSPAREEIELLLADSAMLIDGLRQKSTGWSEWDQAIRDRLTVALIGGHPASPVSKRVERLETVEPKTLDEWSEDDGDVVWWCWRDGAWLGEAAYIGTPLDLGRGYALTIGDHEFVVNLGGWPGYHTHWTPHPTRPQALQGGRS